MTIVIPTTKRRRRRAAATAKAATLIEALPWLDRFHGETVVIKYGGHAMTRRAPARRVRPGPGVPPARRAPPGGRARRRPAGHRAPGPARHRVGVHRRAAGHHGRDHRRGPDGAQRQGQQGHRRPDQPVRPVRGRPVRRGRQPVHRRRKHAEVDGEPVDIGLVGEIIATDPSWSRRCSTTAASRSSPASRAARTATARSTTSTPTPPPPPSRSRSARPSWSCSPTSRASTGTGPPRTR